MSPRRALGLARIPVLKRLRGRMVRYCGAAAWTMLAALGSAVQGRTSVAVAQGRTAASTALDEGVQRMRAGQWEQARERLNAAHREEPRNAAVENLLGIVETQLGHGEEARGHYRNAIRLNPAEEAPHKNLGFSLMTARRYAEAEPELRAAVRLQPGDAFAHDYLAMVLLGTGQDAEALAEAARAGSLPEKDPEIAAQLAEALIRTGRAEEAATRLERLEQAGELSAAREYPIATLLAARGDTEQAVHCFRRIARLDPAWQNRYNLALELLYAGQAGEAAGLLETLRTEQPDNADILTFLGSALEAQQKMPEALEAYRRAAAADPANPDRTLDYTRLLMDLDRYDEAIEMVNDRMDLAGGAATAPLQLRLGAVEMLKSDYPAARAAFERALAADSTLDVAYVGLAQTYAREANDAEALRVLEAARVKLAGRYLLEYYFGLLAGRQGREQEAQVALTAATRLEPSSADPWYELGKLAVVRQDWPAAREAFEHVIQLNPKLAPAHYQLGRVYAHLGLTGLAEQEAQTTHTLVDTQRDEALRRQRERAGSFQRGAAVSGP